MTEKQLIAKIISGCRKIWLWYDPNRKVCEVSSVVNRINPSTGRKKKFFKCVKCGCIKDKIEIDHIEEIGKQPTTFLGLGEWVNKLFCGLTNLQALCKVCHVRKVWRNELIY